jgi:hypothetical protein
MENQSDLLFADKSENLISKIEFVNALTHKEITTLNSKYLDLGLYIKQVIVDYYGNEINEKKSFNLLGKKRERKTFNYLNDFLQKYYGEDDLSSISKSTINTHKKRKVSDIEANKKCSTVEISELTNNLNSIKEDCQKIEYKYCKIDADEFKSKIIDYILKIKKFLLKEQYSFLFNKWKNEYAKIKGVDIMNFEKINNILNWKIPILKAFKSEMILYAMCNVCDNYVKRHINNERNNNKSEEDEPESEENKINNHKYFEEKKENESSDLDLSDFTDEENSFNHKNDAVLLQLVKHANNDEDNV